MQAKVEPNFEKWTEKERERFTLKKTVTVSKILNNEIVERDETLFTDNGALRDALEKNPMLAPDAARLVKRVSLCYGLRKRLQKGV